MNALLRPVRKKLFGISRDEILFERRRFRCRDAAIKTYLEERGAGFVTGYNLAMDNPEIAGLGDRLDVSVASHDRGFAYEGAAMALYLLDMLTPWGKSRFNDFIEGPARPHIYMAYVGAGWAIARIALRPHRHLDKMDPVLGWLAMDGYGFHEVFFHPQKMLGQKTRPKRLRGYARRVFDQGLGRGLWFALGADVAYISETIAGFDAERRADLWSGIGLACAYAGGIDETEIESLRAACRHYAPHLAQGAVFAAAARERAGNGTPHNEIACRVLCGMSMEDAVILSDRQRAAADPERPEPVYEQWRGNIRSALEPAMVYNTARTSES